VILYTRHQLALLLTLLAASGVGLAVREWRAAYPGLAERLEQFDRRPLRGDGSGGGKPPASACPTLRDRPREASRRAVGNERDPRGMGLNAATGGDLTPLPGGVRTECLRPVAKIGE
jgi:hypothetical protein